MHLGRSCLVLACAGYAAAALRLCPGWLLAKYPHLAERLRAGRLTAAEAADASPAYLLLHSAVAPDTVRLLQLAAGVATIACVYVIAARWRGPIAGVVAAGLLALSQGWIVYASALEPDLIIGALHAAALVALLGRGRVRASAAAGLALGLACALRPTSFLAGAVVLLWLIVDRRGRRGWHAAGFAGCLALAAFLPAALLHARAGQQLGATMSAGQVLHQGHRPEDSGVRAHYPLLIKLLEASHATRPDHRPDYAHELYRTFAYAAGVAANPTAAERYWIEAAARVAQIQPAAFLRQLARKWVFTLTAPSPGADIAAVAAAVQRLPAGPWIPAHLLALLGFAGLLLAWSAGREARLLGGFVLAAQAVALVFYHQARYGVALLPIWAVLIGALVAGLWGTRRSPARLALRLGVAALPFALLLLPFVAFEHRLEARRLLVPVDSPIPRLRAAGELAAARSAFLDEQASFPDSLWPWSPRGYGLRADDPATAMAAAERARARFPGDDPVDDYLLAVLYAQADRCDLALPLADHAADAGFHGTLEDSDVALDPDLLASDCLLALGRRDEALARIRHSLAGWPGTIDGLSRLVAATHGQEGRATLAALHDPASVHFALARTFRLWGDLSGALAEANALADQLPEAAPVAAYERARSLLDLGVADDAVAAYARSLGIGYFVYGSSRFDEPIRAFLARHPDHPGARELYRRHADRQGNGG